MCDTVQVFSSLRHEGREREFYPWYAIKCLLLGQDCYRTAYTYNVKDFDSEAFKIIDGMSPQEAYSLFATLLERLEKEPSLGDFVKALAVNHLYLKHEHSGKVLSGELINKLVRKYGWNVIGVLLAFNFSLLFRYWIFGGQDYPENTHTFNFSLLFQDLDAHRERLRRDKD